MALLTWQCRTKLWPQRAASSLRARGRCYDVQGGVQRGAVSKGGAFSSLRSPSRARAADRRPAAPPQRSRQGLGAPVPPPPPPSRRYSHIGPVVDRCAPLSNPPPVCRSAADAPRFKTAASTCASCRRRWPPTACTRASGGQSRSGGCLRTSWRERLQRRPRASSSSSSTSAPPQSTQTAASAQARLQTPCASKPSTDVSCLQR